MECKFQVGDMVVAILDPSNWKAPPPHPVKGNFYTVSGFCKGPHCNGSVGVFVEEIRAAGGAGADGIVYCSCYQHTIFRPVRKTNIEALRSLVIKPKVKFPIPHDAKPMFFNSGHEHQG